MSANTFGNLFKFTSFGESHGPSMGVVIDGCPAGIKLDMEKLLVNLSRRRPGQSEIVTDRNETDSPEILCGVYKGMTLGSPIAVLIKNKNQKSSDYNEIKNSPRQGHADELYLKKYGHADLRGGGRASGRETVSRVIAGSFAQMILNDYGLNIKALCFADQIGPVSMSEPNWHQVLGEPYPGDDFSSYQNSTRFLFDDLNRDATELLTQAKVEGKSYGGSVTCIFYELPIGLGQPVFHKLKSDLAAAIMSIGATYGFQIGLSHSSLREGSEMHQSADPMNYGGLRGGLSTGEPLAIQVKFKPTSSVLDVAKKGRHDPCIVPRAVCVVENMIWSVICDHVLWQKVDKK